MFQSKTRSIVIPLSEHTRLAGTIAYHWGNTDFIPPPFDTVDFAAGVTYHDRGYNLIDTMALVQLTSPFGWRPNVREST